MTLNKFLVFPGKYFYDIVNRNVDSYRLWKKNTYKIQDQNLKILLKLANNIWYLVLSRKDKHSEKIMDNNFTVLFELNMKFKINLISDIYV